MNDQATLKLAQGEISFPGIFIGFPERSGDSGVGAE